MGTDHRLVHGWNMGLRQAAREALPVPCVCACRPSGEGSGGEHGGERRAGGQAETGLSSGAGGIGKGTQTADTAKAGVCSSLPGRTGGAEGDLPH